jgi:hypothetical protein
MGNKISIGCAFKDQDLTDSTLTTCTITGGTINNATVGATTAAAGTFTTLTMTSPVIGSDTVLATGAEINRVADSSTRVVATTATTITVSATVHGSKVVVVNASSAAAINLPVASATGEIYTFVIGVAATATAHVIAANGTDIIQGVSLFSSSATGEVSGFATSASSDKITINGTTQGGMVGDKIVLIDIAANTWQVTMNMQASGTVATPFSAT